ncbi:dTDP-4-dehydrorhamnose 3,5-epimerase [Maribacter sp. 2210JD10-5]|uniref:dTDP-4-dehydrorhamnose 3,5-epimerase n=1 Tax=Maribacter sp. 2210JD10-5 TaxID=3386272 RepID=UPI0039BD4569
MKVTETILRGCFIIEPTVFKDERGIFFESFRKDKLEKAIGYSVNFVQDNQSISKKGVLRGLHFQKDNAAQAKLISVVKGKVLDIVVDIRPNSSNCGKYIKVELSSENKKRVYIPKGMAHGFLALSDETIVNYKCDTYYNPEAESGIIYNDKDLDIDWEYPNEDLIISPKDFKFPNFSEL